jgi:aminopeptidase N
LWAEHKYGVEQADYLGQIETEQYFAESREKQEPLIRYYYGTKKTCLIVTPMPKGKNTAHAA